jgi:hypothetical protein
MSLLDFGYKTIELTDGDFCVVDLHNRKVNPHGNFIKATKNQQLAWHLLFTIQTIPAYAYNDPIIRKQLEECNYSNNDTFELEYVVDAVCIREVVDVIAAKIYTSFVDANTILLSAGVIYRPMTQVERLKKYGPQKTNISHLDDLHITFRYQPDVWFNADLINRPLTSD